MAEEKVKDKGEQVNGGTSTPEPLNADVGVKVPMPFPRTSYLLPAAQAH
jgi:hypothetical protein